MPPTLPPPPPARRRVRHVPSRPSLLCSTDYPLCPRCTEVLRRVNVLSGVTLDYCDERGADGRRCGQHVVVFGWPAAHLCVVTPITREELPRLRQLAAATSPHLLPYAVSDALGIVIPLPGVTL